MLRWILPILALISTMSCHSAHAAVDETWFSVSNSNSQSRAEFASASSMKEKRRMGVSTHFTGAVGLSGLSLDLNLTSRLSASIGLGASRGFQSFNMHFRNYFSGKNFTPYFTGGYSRWYSNDRERVGNTAPAFFSKKFLSGGELRKGEFAENILYPGFGAQYMNLSGEWAGFGYYMEALYLVDMDDLVAAPTVGVGINYLF
jgi:hypothetical protein